MNFSEALHLVVSENEKITRAAWQNEEWQRQNPSLMSHGEMHWVMALRPNMFGLPEPEPGSRDRIAAFDRFGVGPLSEHPQLMRVTMGKLQYDPPYRYHLVSYWAPDMQDMLANDWEIAISP